MTHVEDVLLWAIAQKGDRYRFGAEVAAGAADSGEWDCSELVEWACRKAGVRPVVPDGAFNQWAACRQAGTMIGVVDGLNTRGALLFVGDGTGTGRDAITHVAFSLGDGTTIEARGRKWGVGCWTAVDRFDFAARIPGVGHDHGHAPLQVPPGPSIPVHPGSVRKGSRGDAVRQVQQRLRDRGWTIAVDGVFGGATDNTVRSFQDRHGLTVDGVVGPKTWEALWRAPIT